MSDLAATNCGCGCDGGNNNCSLFSFSVEDVVITDVETEFLVAMTAVQ